MLMQSEKKAREERLKPKTDRKVGRPKTRDESLPVSVLSDKLEKAYAAKHRLQVEGNTIIHRCL